MTESIFKSLEFVRIMDFLAEYSLSELGREQIHAIYPLANAEAVQQALAEVSDFRELIDFDQAFPTDGIADIRSLIEKAKISGSILTVVEFEPVQRFLGALRSVQHYFSTRSEKYLHLWPYAAQLVPMPAIEKQIDRCIDFASMEVKESASDQLQAIRRAIRSAEQRLRKAVENIARQLNARGFLQDNLISMREGRFVLMVKEEHKRHVPGLVHDQSASGASFFIEPFETIEMNNQIRELQIQEKKEINRILGHLTGMIHERVDELEHSLHAIAKLEFIYAKAMLSRAISGNQPLLSQENSLRILHGRHPLLVLLHGQKETVVPLTLELNENRRTLVITGPNAGGKTVALKTVGLLVLMTLCGLHIPASPDSSIPLVEQIFVDIGDLQSIENDLSTFSSHLENIRAIYEQANSNSLVLIDEIGSGTDPEEGAALAMALLEFLTRMGALSIVTTHQGVLKVFAQQHPGVENGSMEFDAEGLTPTYRFRMGIPGSSYAFEIAHRLGLNPSLTDRARDLLGSQKNNLEQLLAELEHKTQQYEGLIQKNAARESELQLLVQQYQDRVQEIEREEKRLKRRAVEESEDILRQANAAIELAVKEIREKNAATEAIRTARSLLKEQTEQIEKFRQEVGLEPEPVEEIPDTGAKLQPGDPVRWHKYGTTGIVLSEPDSGNKVLFQSGDIKIRVAVNELVRVSAKPKKWQANVTVTRNHEKPTVTDELDLRGLQAEEALRAVDDYLEEALLLGFQQVRLIHGKGTGALRKAVTRFLKSHPRVRAFRLGRWTEGDTGVTMVQIKVPDVLTTE